jgi:hypothetical protein
MKAVRNWHSRIYGGGVIYADEMLALLADARVLGPERLAQGEPEHDTCMMTWSARG